ncbi:hypothetical protein ACQ86N_09930 [Puia sp. P3]|uniref:hypothetical protein n=1 Tax=Puia sp. P3 TaxID=3423952 RepID=UPI003D67A717
MPSATTPISRSLDRILVIDDLPLIPLAFQEVFQKINPSVHVSWSENIYTTLSARAWDNTTSTSSSSARCRRAIRTTSGWQSPPSVNASACR